MKKLLLLSCLFLFSIRCSAMDSRFTVVRVDPRSEHLQLFLHDQKGNYFHNFNALSRQVTAQNRRLRVAMNAGMFKPNFSPVGLYIDQGKERSPLNLSDGSGNFFMKPNGVFFLTAKGAAIIESSKYAVRASDVLLATQSGPLLVQQGTIHPALGAQSQSRLIRNGVGINNGIVYLVISNQPVTFYEFARFFRDDLHCQDALYLDGVVSGLFSSDLKRNDKTVKLGPILAVIE